MIREKELAFDAQLSATEIVRRCERRIGELVREGQREGKIATRGSDTRNRVQRDVLGPAEVIGAKHRSEVAPLYAMADAPAGEFEQAVTDARDEGNLSRADSELAQSVVRGYFKAFAGLVEADAERVEEVVPSPQRLTTADERGLKLDAQPWHLRQPCFDRKLRAAKGGLATGLRTRE
ncbi:MAG TPA: hypothetical protein VIJ66_07550 [Solirubrobacteraceae bacterium]